MTKKIVTGLCTILLFLTFSSGCLTELISGGEVEIIVNKINNSLDKVEINLTFKNKCQETIKINHMQFKLYDTNKLCFRCYGPRNLPEVKKGESCTFNIYFDTSPSSGKFTKLKYINQNIDKIEEVDLLKRGVNILVHEKVEVGNDWYLNLSFANYYGKTIKLNHSDFKLVDAKNQKFACYGPKDLGEIENNKNLTFVLYFDIRDKMASIITLEYINGCLDKEEIVNIRNV